METNGIIRDTQNPKGKELGGAVQGQVDELELEVQAKVRMHCSSWVLLGKTSL